MTSDQNSSPSTILLFDHLHHRRLNFTHPDRVVAAFTLNEALPALREINQAVQQGKWAAGFIAYEAAPRGRTLAAALAPSPISSPDIFLFHKTTHRQVYDQARAACPGFVEVLLWNERGEVTEFTASNVVIQWWERCYTPPVECGLLPGTFRGALLEKGIVAERAIRVEELEEADAILAINSVRGWQRVNLRLGFF